MMNLLWHSYIMYIIPVLLSYIPYVLPQSPNEILDFSTYMTLERFTVTLQNLEKISLSVSDQLTTLTSDVAAVSEKVEDIRIELKELKMKQDSQFKDVVTSIKQGQSNSTQAFNAVKSDTISIHQKLQKLISEMSEAKVEEMKMLESIDARMNIIQIMQNEQMTVDDENFQTLRMEQKDMLCSLNTTLNELTQTQFEKLENATAEIRTTQDYLCSEFGNISAHIEDLKTHESQETLKILTDLGNLKNMQLKQFPAIISVINDTKEDHAKELSILDSKVEEVRLEHERGFGVINSRILDLNKTHSNIFGKILSDFNEVGTLTSQQIRETTNGFNNVLSKQSENLHIIMSNFTDLKESHSLQKTAVLNSVGQLKSSQTNHFDDVISDLHKMKVTHSNQLDHVGRSLKDMKVQQGDMLSTINHDVQMLLNVTAPPAGPTVTETPVALDVAPLACVQATGNLDQLPSSCAEVQERGETRSGKYVIVLQYLNRLHPVLAYCDLETDGGGWTVFQKRGNNGNPNDYFYKSWSNYVEGFGYPDKDFWLGLKYIYTLSNQEPVSLRFDLWDWEGDHRYAATRNFRLTNLEKFTITWDGYSGNAGNSLPRSNIHFTTFDKDQDLLRRGNCAQKHQGAWWYSNCHKSNLNGCYNSTDFGTGVNWFNWHGIFYSLKETEIKLRPRDFQMN